MANQHNDDLLASWLHLTQLHHTIAGRLEAALTENHALSLKEFYMLYFLYAAPEKKLRLQDLESMVGLSQSALSRLVSRFEAKGCGAMRRYTCEADRRGVYTSLTEYGQDKVERALQTVQDVLRNELLEERMHDFLKCLNEKRRDA